MKKALLSVIIISWIFTSCSHKSQVGNLENSLQTYSEIISETQTFMQNDKFSESDTIKETLDGANTEKSYIPYNENDIYLLSEICNFPFEEEINIKKLNVCIDFVNDDTDILKSFVNLEDLWIYSESFNYSYQGDDEFEFLNDYQNLKTLSVTAECAVFDMRLICENIGLTKLELNGFDKINNFNLIEKLIKLESLTLYGDGNIGPTAQNLESISSLKEIKYLFLDNVRISETEEYTNLYWLNNMFSLEELHLLSFYGITQIDDLSNLENLHTLEIYRLENLNDYSFTYDLLWLRKFIYTEYFIDDSQIEKFKELNPECELICVAT